MLLLPPLASAEDLQEWSASSITNEARAEAILAAASTLIRSFTGRMWVVAAEAEEDPPVWEEGVTDLEKDQVLTVVLTVADRVYSNPMGATQQTAGPFSRSVAAWSTLGLALTDDEKDMLGGSSPGISGLSSVRMLAPAAASASRILSWPAEDDDE